MKIHLLFLSVILSLVPFGIWAALAQVEPLDTTSARFDVLQSDDQGMLLRLQTSDYRVEDVLLDGLAYQRLSVDGLASIASPGAPLLPMQSVLIGAPAGAEIEVEIVADQRTLLPGRYRLLLSPVPAAITEDAQPGYLVDAPAAVVSSQTGVIPANPARLASDGWLRDQRVLRLEISPFQYDASTGQVTWRRDLTIAVRFVGGERPAAVAQPAAPPDAFARVLAPLLLNADIAAAWRQMPAAAVRDAYTHPGETQTAPAYRIAIRQDGIYQLTAADLTAAGMNLSLVDPRTFHMTSQGRDVAILVTGEEDGVFDSGDTLTFFGEAFSGDYLASLYADENRFWYTYTQQITTGNYVLWHPDFTAEMVEKYPLENIYWLSEGGVPGPRIATRNGDPSASNAPIPAYYPTTVHAEQDNRWWSWHFQTEDTWYWERAVHPYQPYPRTYTTTLSALADEPLTATVRAAVGARVSMDSFPNDHHTTFSLNAMATPLDDAYWEGKSRYTFEAQVSQAELLEGENSLIFNALSDSTASRDFYFDWFEIDYFRRFDARDDQLSFTGVEPGEWRYRAAGFSSDQVIVFDVSDPLLPVQVLNPEVIGAAANFSVTFTATQSSQANFFVAGQSAVGAPYSLTFYEPPELLSSSNQADYIFIVHPDFLDGIQPLVDYRAAQGFSTLVVDINDVYAIFGDGIFHPIAIKNFLAYTFSHWQPPAPQYVLLVGDGHLNMQGHNPAWYGSDPWFIPPSLGWVDPWQGEVDASNLLVNIVGDDPLPDVFLGRLLVNSEAELDTVIQKTITYEQLPPQSWQRRLLFLTDNGPDPAGDFEASAEMIISQYVPDTFTPDRVYTTDLCGPPNYTYCPDARNALTDTLNTTGTLIIEYIGHGHIQRWAQEPIFRNSDVTYLHNAAMLPVILSMTCMDNFWFGTSVSGTDAPLGPSLIELLVRSAGKGAVATFSPGGLGVGTGHDALAMGFYSAVFDHGSWRMGPASLSAKLHLYASGMNYDLLNTFMIVGDPALHILSPYDVDASPETQADSALAGSEVVYSFDLTNLGQVTDTFQLSLSGNVWTTTTPLSVGPLPAGFTQSLTLTVHIPSSVVGGAQDSAVLDIYSMGDGDRRARLTFETTADVYGVQVRPASASRIGLPGDTVAYTMQVTNTSNTSDTFSIALGEHEWLTHAPTSTAVLGANASQVFSVTVSISEQASDYQSESVAVTITSVTDPSRLAVSSLTTTARLHGVQLSPSSDSQSALPGAAAVYHLTLTNSGGYADAFSVTLAANPLWLTAIEPPLTPQLAPGGSIPVTVTVTLPATAAGNAAETIEVLAISQADADQLAQSTLTTTALPVYQFSLAADLSAQTGAPGETVTYTLVLTNDGNITDTFSVTLSGQQWASQSPATLGPLAAGQSLSFSVTVTVPTGALGGEQDVALVTVESQGNAGSALMAQLTTTAEPPDYRIYLPLVMR